MTRAEQVAEEDPASADRDGHRPIREHVRLRIPDHESLLPRNGWNDRGDWVHVLRIPRDHDVGRVAGQAPIRDHGQVDRFERRRPSGGPVRRVNVPRQPLALPWEGLTGKVRCNEQRTTSNEQRATSNGRNSCDYAPCFLISLATTPHHFEARLANDHGTLSRPVSARQLGHPCRPVDSFDSFVPSTSRGAIGGPTHASRRA